MKRLEKEFLALRHYSRTKPATCSLQSGNLESFFTVKLKDSSDIYQSITKGDPITFGRLDNEKDPTIIGGFVLMKAESDEITISPDMTSFAVERRHCPRYPVSIIGYLKYGNHMESTSTAWVKDISYEGLRICTKTDLEIQDEIEVNICISNHVLNVEGLIVRKKALYDRYEYGVQITFRYKSTVFTTREYVDNLILQEKRIIQNHLSSICY